MQRSVLSPADAPLVLTSGSEEPRVVAALDVPRGTSLGALVEPLRYVERGAIVSRGILPPDITPEGWRSRVLPSFEALPDSVRVILSAGSYRAVSIPLMRAVRGRGVRLVVVQHGVLTPFAIPLPDDCELFAWNEAEAAFWSEGRSDVVSTVVGSQLLWRAAQEPAGALESESPLWLGQLHGTELPKRSMAAAATDCCLRHGATYRAHPAERGVVERLYHAWWRARGMQFDDGTRPLREIARPVVSIFSTGILEAAARGLPAWAHHPAPPRWVEELWVRHGIGTDRSAGTTAEVPTREPASTVAALIAG